MNTALIEQSVGEKSARKNFVAVHGRIYIDARGVHRFTGHRSLRSGGGAERIQTCRPCSRAIKARAHGTLRRLRLTIRVRARHGSVRISFALATANTENVSKNMCAASRGARGGLRENFYVTRLAPRASKSSSSAKGTRDERARARTNARGASGRECHQREGRAYKSNNSLINEIARAHARRVVKFLRKTVNQLIGRGTR